MKTNRDWEQTGRQERKDLKNILIKLRYQINNIQGILYSGIS